MLPIPTVAMVKTVCEDFDKENRLSEDALTELCERFPRNTEISHVLLKVLALNKLYSTRIFDKDIEATALYILSLSVDKLLDHGVHEVVSSMSNVPGLRRCYSFATKFCSWHNAEAFPIYDQYVDQCLWSYKKQAERSNQSPFMEFHRQDMLQYEKFVVVATAFRSHFELGTLTFKELDKFWWRVGFQINNGSDSVR